jgi:hypothetical protein
VIEDVTVPGHLKDHDTNIATGNELILGDNILNTSLCSDNRLELPVSCCSVVRIANISSNNESMLITILSNVAARENSTCCQVGTAFE